MRKAFALLAIAGAAGIASGQNISWAWEWNDDGDGDGCVEPGESATAMLFATFDSPPGTAFAGSILSILNSGGWSAGSDTISYDGNDALGQLSNEDGTNDGNGNILTADHFQLPKFFNPGIVEDNPIHIGTLSFSTTDYSNRNVTWMTSHVNHSVYLDDFGTSVEFNPTIGGLDIKVAPTPASLALLGLGGLAAARRRR